MNTTKFLALSLVIGAGMMVQPAATLADELSNTTIKTAQLDEASSTHTFKSVSGPGGAHVSETHTRTGANLDGSVSRDRIHESHTVDALGSVHHKSATSTMLSPDGSTSTVHHETERREGY